MKLNVPQSITVKTSEREYILEVREEIGIGTYSTVYLAYLEGTAYALKVANNLRDIRVPERDSNQHVVNGHENIRRIHKKHKDYTVSSVFLGTIEEEESIFVVQMMELSTPYKTLAEHLDKLTMKEKEKVYDLVEKMVTTLADEGIYHGDLHLKNILLTKDPQLTVKLIDFGYLCGQYVSVPYLEEGKDKAAPTTHYRCVKVEVSHDYWLPYLKRVLKEEAQPDSRDTPLPSPPWGIRVPLKLALIFAVVCLVLVLVGVVFWLWSQLPNHSWPIPVPSPAGPSPERDSSRPPTSIKPPNHRPGANNSIVEQISPLIHVGGGCLDTIDRDAASFEDAERTCRSSGGHLSTTGELGEHLGGRLCGSPSWPSDTKGVGEVWLGDQRRRFLHWRDKACVYNGGPIVRPFRCVFPCSSR